MIVGLILISQIAGAMGPKTTAISAEYTGKTMEGTKVSIDDFTVTAKKDDGTSETVEDAELNSDYTLVYGKTTAAKITYDNHSTTVKIVCNQKKPTTGEKNALAKAKEYLSTMPFSYKGLIKQLEFEGFSTQEATYGADNCKADWNEQAAKSAKNYMEISSFSESGLIEQLEFEGYTEEQAEYGAKKAGY